MGMSLLLIQAYKRERFSFFAMGMSLSLLISMGMSLLLICGRALIIQ